MKTFSCPITILRALKRKADCISFVEYIVRVIIPNTSLKT